MLFLLIAGIQARTHLHVNEILIGNWTVNKLKVQNKSQNPSEEIVNLEFIKHKENQIGIMLNNEYLTIIFESKGFFEIFDQSGNKIAEMDFSHPLFPHATSSGMWNKSSTFIAELISTSSMKLSLFNSQTKDTCVFLFSKIVLQHPKSFIEKNFTMIATLVVIGIHFLKSEYKKRRNALELQHQNETDMRKFLEEEDHPENEEENNGQEEE